MKGKVIKLVSYIGTICIIYGIYNEAGPYTASFAILMWVYCEISTRFMEQTNNNLKMVGKIIGVKNDN